MIEIVVTSNMVDGGFLREQGVDLRFSVEGEAFEQSLGDKVHVEDASLFLALAFARLGHTPQLRGDFSDDGRTAKIEEAFSAVWLRECAKGTTPVST